MYNFEEQINIACIRICPGRTMSSLRNASQISFNQHIKQLIKSSLKLYQALRCAAILHMYIFGDKNVNIS